MKAGRVGSDAQAIWVTRDCRDERVEPGSKMNVGSVRSGDEGAVVSLDAVLES